MPTSVNLNQPLFNSPRPTTCKQTGWRAQFACPTGKLGWIAGQIMALKNAAMNRYAVSVIAPRPEDQVLEIGFGHGKTVRLLAERAHKGFVAGIDISDVMVRQSAKRNQDLIQTGRVELSQASVTDIPYEYGRFNKVLAVNNYQFWPNAELNLDEIRRVLAHDGLLVLCLRRKQPNKAFQVAPGYTTEEIVEIAGLVRWVGFRDVQILQQQGTGEAACVVARR